MPGPLMEKASLWRDRSKGVTARLSDEAKDPAVERDDIPDLLTNQSVQRGDRLQAARLKRYPSIDVDHTKVFAGRMDGSLSDAEDRLRALGFRTNPTAYVEVSDKNGPDDGSYSKVLVTETSARVDVPMVTVRPSLFRRIKDQIHIVVWETEDGIAFGAHREQHAWLQPARHVVVNDSNYEIAVRDFRDMWFDEFGEELGGGDEINWESTH